MPKIEMTVTDAEARQIAEAQAAGIPVRLVLGASRASNPSRWLGSTLGQYDHHYTADLNKRDYRDMLDSGVETVQHPDHSEEWFLDGELHREGEPAVITEETYDGRSRGRTEYWYRHGKLHREGEPAVYSEDHSFRGWQDTPPTPIYRAWYRNGQLQRQEWYDRNLGAWVNEDPEYFETSANHRADNPSTSHGWELLEGDALRKALRVTGESWRGLDDESLERVRCWAKKFGRKTVFAFDTGVFRLRVTGNEPGQVFQMKTYGSLETLDTDARLLLEAVHAGEPNVPKGIYRTVIAPE